MLTGKLRSLSPILIVIILNGDIITIISPISPNHWLAYHSKVKKNNQPRRHNTYGKKWNLSTNIIIAVTFDNSKSKLLCNTRHLRKLGDDTCNPYLSPFSKNLSLSKVYDPCFSLAAWSKYRTLTHRPYYYWILLKAPCRVLLCSLVLSFW